MGIIVTIAMLLALCVLWPSPWRYTLESRAYTKVIALLVLLAGFWNALWYGTRHLQDFWGHAAIVSGCFMIAAAVLIFYQLVLAGNATKPAWVKGFQWLVLAGLLGCFALYFVTLVQLNLGYSIIR